MIQLPEHYDYAVTHGRSLSIWRGVQDSFTKYGKLTRGQIVYAEYDFASSKWLLPLMPGMILQKKLRKMGAARCQLCDGTARLMDEIGPNECYKRFDEIVGMISQNAQKNESLLGALSKKASKSKIGAVGLSLSIRFQLNRSIRRSERRIRRYILERPFH